MSQSKSWLLKACDSSSRFTVLSPSLKSVWKLSRNLIIHYLIVISHYLLPYFLCEVHHRKLYVPLKKRKKNHCLFLSLNIIITTNFEVLCEMLFFLCFLLNCLFYWFYKSLFIMNLELILYSKWNLYSVICCKIFSKFVA